MKSRAGGRVLTEVDGIIRTKMAKSIPNNNTEELQQREIEGFFEALRLSTAGDRQRFLQFERFSEDADSAQDRGMETLRVVFGDGTIPMPTPK